MSRKRNSAAMQNLLATITLGCVIAILGIACAIITIADENVENKSTETTDTNIVATETTSENNPSDA